jgi:hypothetical protein
MVKPVARVPPSSRCRCFITRRVTRKAKSPVGMSWIGTPPVTSRPSKLGAGEVTSAGAPTEPSSTSRTTVVTRGSPSGALAHRMRRAANEALDSAAGLRNPRTNRSSILCSLSAATRLRAR